MNISLPRELEKVVEREVRRGKFSTTSEYIRHLVREDEFYSLIEQSNKDFAAGKGKVLKSLKSLE